MFFQKEENQILYNMCPLQKEANEEDDEWKRRDGSFNDWEVFHGSRVGHADIRELCRATIMRNVQMNIVA